MFHILESGGTRAGIMPWLVLVVVLALAAHRMFPRLTPAGEVSQPGSRHQPGPAWLEFTMYCIVYTLDRLLLHFWSSILLKQNKQTRVKSSSMPLYETEE